MLCSASLAQNGLDFDGVDDQVIVENASGLITSGSGIALACWVNPTTADFYGGMAGFRNELDADFYLLQLWGGGLEARFRNSEGTEHTLGYPELQMGVWQFLVLSYDGSELVLYYNGSPVGSMEAQGSIPSATEPFRIGAVGVPDMFFMPLHGLVDEVALWDRALTAEEVRCLYNAGIHAGMDGLQLYYPMEQGTAGGDNTGITTLTDAQGNIDGVLTDMALTGTTSNFVQGVAPVVHGISATICAGGSYLFNGEELTEAGEYLATVSGGECDSTVMLTLEVNAAVDAGVTELEGGLMANATEATYQWLDCSEGYAVIPDATEQTFLPDQGGSYAVLVTQGECADTSACHAVVVTGIREQAGLDARLFPDPARDQVRITLGAPAARLDLSLCDMNGREVWRGTFNGTSTVDLSLEGLTDGVYLVRLATPSRRDVLRLVKQ